MKILLARTAGFCMGVRRAMETAVDAARAAEGPVRTQGPLIHNTQALELLAARGIGSETEEGAASLPSGCTVVLRAHGVPPEERTALAARDLVLVDATCPHVLRSQDRIAVASREGRPVVIVGDPEHAEVRALVGCAGGAAVVIGTEEEALALAPGPAPVVLAQTTFHSGRYRRIAEAVRERFPEATVYDSVCTATERRQAEAGALAERAEVLVVVGGRHSANTRRLAEIGAGAGARAVHVETAAELDPAAFADVRTVAVTAGASTPGWLTDQVIERLETFGPGGLRGGAMGLLRALTRARVGTALGAGALAGAVAVLTGTRAIPLDGVVIAALYVFVAYTFNRREAPEEARLLVPVDSFYRDHRRVLLPAGLLAGLGALLLAARAGWPALLLVALGLLAATLYRVPVLPHRFHHRRLQDLPGSKDLTVALAWACVVVGAGTLPRWREAGLVPMALAGGLVFLLLFAKTTMLDLRDTESDHMIGLETMPVLLGRARAVLLVRLALWSVLLVSPLLAAAGLLSPFAYLFVIVPVYGLAALRLLRRGRIRRPVTCQMLMDGQLLLAGTLAILWRLAQGGAG